MLTAGQIKLVIVDDDQDDYFILSDVIKNIAGSNIIIDWCNNYDEAVAKIKAREYDIYFVDYRLGSKTGLDLLKEVKANELDDPIVLLTGKGNMDIDRKAMRYGATDYIIKSELNPEKIERCIRYSLDRANDLRELRSSEQKYRALFENSKDAIFIIDEQLQMVELNQAASALFACPRDNASDFNLLEFIKDDGAKRQLNDLFHIGRNIHDLEIEIRNKNNDTRSCLFSLAFPSESDGSTQIHAIIHDITNIKQTEIMNLQAQKMAANERLMRTLAHEIRNPLNNIGLSVDHFTLPMEDDDDNRNLLAILQRNSVRINQIITELLNITNKASDIALEKHTLQEILEESIDMTIDRINLQKVRLVRNFPNNPLEIAANKSKLIIAFTNIIINAIEAMEPGKGELTVSLSTSPGRYNVRIGDNGIGISSEYIPRLFEPFFTLKKNGTGLGLAACYSIIHSHKGDIKVDSEVNEGTTFNISFHQQN